MTVKLAGKNLLGHIWASTRRVFIGFSIGAVTGIPLGLFMALNRYINAFVKPLFDLFKPMPPLAWISVAILWFGIGESSKIFIIVIGAFVPCVLNAYSGIRIIEEELYDVVRVLGGTRWHEIIQVSFPAALPALFAGIQISLSISWTCVLAAELVSARAGLGWIIIRGMKLSKPEMVLGGMVMIAMVATLGVDRKRAEAACASAREAQIDFGRKLVERGDMALRSADPDQPVTARLDAAKTLLSAAPRLREVLDLADRVARLEALLVQININSGGGNGSFERTTRLTGAR